MNIGISIEWCWFVALEIFKSHLDSTWNTSCFMEEKKRRNINFGFAQNLTNNYTLPSARVPLIAESQHLKLGPANEQPPNHTHGLIFDWYKIYTCPIRVNSKVPQKRGLNHHPFHPSLKKLLIGLMSSACIRAYFGSWVRHLGFPCSISKTLRGF